MELTKGDDRILYIKWQGQWLPVGCLTSNGISESSEMLPTTTRDNNGWATSRPTNQEFSISFEGLQLNTTADGGTFTVASYDKLKTFKRNKNLLDWKIQGLTFPIVDYGQGHINAISEASAVEEFLSFSGSIVGYGIPKTTSLFETVLNNGDPNILLTVNDDENLIIKTK